MFALIVPSTELSLIVIPKILTDLVGSLLQLSHEGIVPLDSNATPAHLFRLQDYFYTSSLSQSQKKACLAILQTLVDCISLTQLVDAFMTLISNKDGPIWLKQTCGLYLSKFLMRPKGLSSIMDRILDVPGSEDTSYQVIFKLVTSCPNQVSKEEYFKALAPQLLQLFSQGNLKSNTRSVISARIIGKLLQKEPLLAQKFLLRSISTPLALFLSDEKIGIEESVIVKEDELCTCIENLNRILLGNFPDQGLLNSFIPIIPALFRLYCFTEQSKSNLKTTCKEILATFFKISDLSAQIIKQLIIPPIIPSSSYIFSLGPTGGVCIKRITSK